jgi:transcription elongation factor GreA
VSPGSIVTLRYDGDAEDDTQRYFVGSIEERRGDMPVVSPSAPLGKALLGKRAGTTVEYEAPGGALKVTLVAVEA